VLKESAFEGAGIGLFATRDFEEDEFIGFYNGETSTQELQDSRYGGGDTIAPYSVTRDKKPTDIANNIKKDVIDSSCVRSLISLANTAEKEHQCNAQYVEDWLAEERDLFAPSDPSACNDGEEQMEDCTKKGDAGESVPVFAIKPIAKHHEILIWYGPEYIKDMGTDGHVWHRTSKGRGNENARERFENDGRRDRDFPGSGGISVQVGERTEDDNADDGNAEQSPKDPPTSPPQTDVTEVSDGDDSDVSDVSDDSDDDDSDDDDSDYIDD
jgi:hypothetical protein